MRKYVLTPLLLLGSLAAGPATRPATTVPSADFVVTGMVVDEGGNPVANATVYARCGTQHNLIRTGITRSDKAGKYRLAFEPGVIHEKGLGHEVVGFQNALIMVVKSGYFEKNLGRQGDLAMSDDPDHMADKDFAGVVKIHEPYTLDFVLCKGATIEGTMLDPDGKPRGGVVLLLTGPDLPPTGSNLSSVKTDDEGHFVFRDVPTNYAWDFEIYDRDYADIIKTDSFKLTAPEHVSATLTSDPLKHTLVTTQPVAATP